MKLENKVKIIINIVLEQKWILVRLGTVIQFGNKYTYKTNRYYPVLYAKEVLSGVNSPNVLTTGKNKSEEADELISGNASSIANEAELDSDGNVINGGLTVTQTYYYMDLNNSMNISKFFNNSKQAEMLFYTNDGYWLSSREVRCDNKSNSVTWKLSTVNSKTINRSYFIYSYECSSILHF